MPRLPSWCTTTYSLMAEVYTSSYGPGKHRSLFFCLSVTQSQNKQSPTLLNVLKFHLIDAGKQFSQNQQLKVKLIHFLVDRPIGLVHQAWVVTWPGDAKLKRQLQWFFFFVTHIKCTWPEFGVYEPQISHVFSVERVGGKVTVNFVTVWLHTFSCSCSTCCCSSDSLSLLLESPSLSQSPRQPSTSSTPSTHTHLERGRYVSRAPPFEPWPSFLITRNLLS